MTACQREASKLCKQRQGRRDVGDTAGLPGAIGPKPVNDGLGRHAVVVNGIRFRRQEDGSTWVTPEQGVPPAIALAIHTNQETLAVFVEAEAVDVHDDKDEIDEVFQAEADKVPLTPDGEALYAELEAMGRTSL